MAGYGHGRYEDLLLGPNTVCRGKEAFASALRFHPAFVTSAIFSDIPLTSRLPELRLVVDSVAEGRDCVGVEWHVEVGNNAFPLGRGLSQAKIDVRTGKITRVVDIAEVYTHTLALTCYMLHARPALTCPHLLWPVM